MSEAQSKYYYLRGSDLSLRHIGDSAFDLSRISTTKPEAYEDACFTDLARVISPPTYGIGPALVDTIF